MNVMEEKMAVDMAVQKEMEKKILVADDAIAENAVKTYRGIENGVVGGYKKIERAVVGGYKKIEEGAVGGFNKIVDGFVDSFLAKEGETVEEARERLAKEQEQRNTALHTAAHRNIVDENMRKAREASADARRKAGLEYSCDKCDYTT